MRSVVEIEYSRAALNNPNNQLLTRQFVIFIINDPLICCFPYLEISVRACAVDQCIYFWLVLDDVIDKSFH